MARRMATGGLRRVQGYFELEDTFSRPSYSDDSENKRFFKVMKGLRSLQGYMKKRLQELGAEEEGEDSDDTEIQDLRDWLEMSKRLSADAEFGIETLERAHTDLLDYARLNPIEDDVEMDEADIEMKQDETNEDVKMDEGNGEGRLGESEEEVKPDDSKEEVKADDNRKEVKADDNREEVHKNDELTEEKVDVKGDEDKKGLAENVTMIADKDNVMIRNPLGPPVPADQSIPDSRLNIRSSSSPRGVGRGVPRMESRPVTNNQPRFLQPNGLTEFNDHDIPCQVPYAPMPPMMPGYFPPPYLGPGYGQPFFNGFSHPGPGYGPPSVDGFPHPDNFQGYGRRSFPHNGRDRQRQNKHCRQNRSEPSSNDVIPDQFQDASSLSIDMSESESIVSTNVDNNIESENSGGESTMNFNAVAAKCFSSKTPRKQNAAFHRSAAQGGFRTPSRNSNAASPSEDVSGDNAAKRLALRQQLNKSIFGQVFQVGQHEKIAQEFVAQPERGRGRSKTPCRIKSITPSKSKTDQVAKKSTAGTSASAAIPRRSRSTGPEKRTPRKSIERERSTTKSPKVAMPFARLKSKRNRVIYTSDEDDSDSGSSKEASECYRPQQRRRSKSVSTANPRKSRSKSVPRRIVRSPSPDSPNVEPPIEDMDDPEEQARKQGLLVDLLIQLGYPDSDINNAMNDPELYAKMVEMLKSHIPTWEKTPEDPAAVLESEPVPPVSQPPPPSLAKAPKPGRPRIPSPASSASSLAESYRSRRPPRKRLNTGTPAPSETSGRFGDISDDDSTFSGPTSVRKRVDNTGMKTRYKPPDAFINTALDKVKIETDVPSADVKIETENDLEESVDSN